MAKKKITPVATDDDNDDAFMQDPHEDMMEAIEEIIASARDSKLDGFLGEIAKDVADNLLSDYEAIDVKHRFVAIRLAWQMYTAGALDFGPSLAKIAKSAEFEEHGRVGGSLSGSKRAKNSFDRVTDADRDMIADLRKKHPSLSNYQLSKKAESDWKGAEIPDARTIQRWLDLKKL
jgi:hypothetical protein